MLDLYYKLSFILIMSMSVAIIVAFIPLLFIQHFIHKKIFDPIYFNSNHYSAYELGIFISFPLFLVKTLSYIKAIVFPNTMRRKFKDNILIPKERPVVYSLALFSILILVFSALVLVNTGVVGVLIYVNN